MKTNKLSTLSLWLGIAGLFLWEFLFTIIPILAIIFGITAIIKKEEAKTKAYWGIGLGILGLLFGLFLWK